MRSITILILLALALSLVACAANVRSSGPEIGDGLIKVVTTTGMINDIVANIGGNRVTSRALMGSGVDPHLYKASEGDVIRMADADIIFYNGLHLEAKLADVLEKLNGRVRTVAISHYIDPDLLLSPPEFEGNYDPHIWFDVTLWMAATEAVRDALIEIDPVGRESYEMNAARYLVELQELHNYVLEKANRIPTEKRVLITAHDAFNYFGRAYGFEVRGLQGISTAAEAGTADVQELAGFIESRQIPAVFIESSVPARYIEAVQAAVRAKGFEVDIGGELFSDAMGSPGTPEGSYIGMVRHNIDTIVAALTAGQ
jgi:manganese/zinc/iron transport system substrate-binding protein